MNPEEFILSEYILPGQAIFGRFSTATTEEKETGFFIKDNEPFIDLIGDNPKIEIKASIFEYNLAFVVIVMLRINKDNKKIYQLFFNYYNYDGSVNESFNDLIKQNRIIIFFYNNKERKKYIIVDNPLKDSFEVFKSRIEKSNKVWSVDDFDRVKGIVYNEFSEIEMWEQY